MAAEDSYGDPFARFYHEHTDDPPHWRAMFERIGRIVVAWGAAESALAKMWWHLAFENGVELSRDKVYRQPIEDKLKGIRRYVGNDNSRRDQQLSQIEANVPRLQPDRHALVHGYLSITAQGPASLNLRNDHLTFGRDLSDLQAWIEYVADVAHHMYEEAIVAAFDASGSRVYRRAPVPPPPYAPIDPRSPDGVPA